MKLLGFDKMIRFQIVLKAINLYCNDNSKILDVGGGADSILNHTQQKGIILEYGNNKKFCKNGNKYIFYDKLFPFKDNTFDMVVCLDTLEHVPRNLRSTFTSEICRVSKSYTLIINPINYLHYEKLFIFLSYIYALIGLRDFKKYYFEHKLFGIPKFDEIKNQLIENKMVKVFSFKYFGKKSNFIMLVQYFIPILFASFLNQIFFKKYNIKTQIKQKNSIYCCFFYKKT